MNIFYRVTATIKISITLHVVTKLYFICVLSKICDSLSYIPAVVNSNGNVL